MNKIFIPTKGRGFEKQLTVMRLGPAVCSQYMVTLVAPKDEKKALEQSVANSRFAGCVSVIAQPARHPGIAGARDFIIDVANEEKISCCLMLDDDLSFWGVRTVGDNGKVSHLSTDEAGIAIGLSNFFTEIEELQIVHGSIGYKLFANNRPAIDYNSRQLRALAYCPQIVRHEKLKFSKVPVMEDFYMQLSLMQRGYPCLIDNRIVQEQRGSNAPGGCSTYRTPEVQKIAAMALQSLFPRLVTVVEKTDKEGWGGEFGNKRYDVRINWRAAMGEA